MQTKTNQVGRKGGNTQGEREKKKRDTRIVARITHQWSPYKKNLVIFRSTIDLNSSDIMKSRLLAVLRMKVKETNAFKNGDT